jgi:hypothetical protein
MLLVGIGLGMCMLGSICFWLFERYNVNVAICNIFIDFAQVIAIFVGTDVPWPKNLRVLFSYMSILNLNFVELLGIECSVEMSYLFKLQMYQLAPLALFVMALFLFACLHLLAKCLKCCGGETKFQRILKRTHHLADNIIGGYLILLNILYLSLCRSALDVFNCSDTTPSDGYTYLVATHDRCWTGKHSEMLPWAVFGLVMYCILFPVLLFLVLWGNERGIERDMEMRATHDHYQRKESAFYPMSIRYGRFYKYFRPSCRQWNVVIMFRKFYIASTALLFRENPTFQLSIALMGLFGIFVAQVVFRPYWSVEEQDAFAKELFQRRKDEALYGKNIDRSTVAKLHSSAIAHGWLMKTKGSNRHKSIGEDSPSQTLSPIGENSPSHDPIPRRKFITFTSKASKKVAAEKRQSDAKVGDLMEEERATVMGSAKNTLFNLNTIEGIMLVSVICVNLAGIMLLSGQFDSLEKEELYQRDMISYAIIVIIMSSFALLASSLIREIRLARRLTKNMARAKWRVAIRKVIEINKKKRAAGKRFQDAAYDTHRNYKDDLLRNLLNEKANPKEDQSRTGSRTGSSNKVTPFNGGGNPVVVEEMDDNHYEKVTTTTRTTTTKKIKQPSARQLSVKKTSLPMIELDDDDDLL